MGTCLPPRPPFPVAGCLDRLSPSSTRPAVSAHFAPHPRAAPSRRASGKPPYCRIPPPPHGPGPTRLGHGPPQAGTKNGRDRPCRIAQPPYPPPTTTSSNPPPRRGAPVMIKPFRPAAPGSRRQAPPRPSRPLQPPPLRVASSILALLAHSHSIRQSATRSPDTQPPRRLHSCPPTDPSESPRLVNTGVSSSILKLLLNTGVTTASPPKKRIQPRSIRRSPAHALPPPPRRSSAGPPATGPPQGHAAASATGAL